MVLSSNENFNFNSKGNRSLLPTEAQPTTRRSYSKPPFSKASGKYKNLKAISPRYGAKSVDKAELK